MGEWFAMFLFGMVGLMGLAGVVVAIGAPLWPPLKRLLVAYAALNRRLWPRLAGRAPAAIGDGYCGFCNTQGHVAADCTALQVWCRCGSQEQAVPVEVHDGPDGPEVVAWLCPDCREKRRPPGEPVMTDTGPECHNCAEPWSMALDAPRECDRCGKPLPMVPAGSKVPGWARDYVCDGGCGIDHVHPRPEGAADAGERIARRVEKAGALPSCEHDWEEFEVHAHGSAAPVRTFRQCLRCRASADPDTIPT